MDFFTEVPASLFAFVLVQSNSTRGREKFEDKLRLTRSQRNLGIETLDPKEKFHFYLIAFVLV